MTNSEKQVKELCDKLGFHNIILGLISWVENKTEYCGEKIYTAKDEYIPAVLDKLKEAHAAYIARYCTNA
jgi:hypothetical protein